LTWKNKFLKNLKIYYFDIFSNKKHFKNNNYYNIKYYLPPIFSKE
jgi:hypothetical protein